MHELSGWVVQMHNLLENNPNPTQEQVENNFDGTRSCFETELQLQPQIQQFESSDAFVMYLTACRQSVPLHRLPSDPVRLQEHI
jgi:hypothetical protein